MTIIKQALQQIGDYSRAVQVKQLKGGQINETYFVQTDENQYVIKYQTQAPEHFFKKEAAGLEMIKGTNTISTPMVYTYHDNKDTSFIVLEWINGKKQVATEEKLAEQIAVMHSTHSKWHGFIEDTYVGLLKQPNSLYTSWLEYFRDKRLMNQLHIGAKKDLITGKRREQLEKLMVELDKWVPHNVKASYLHGDLWEENWLQDNENKPYIIDPSFLYGDRHFELSYMELFGGFSDLFFQVYTNLLPSSDTYKDVKPIYQLYYLLVHLNTFGEIYGSHVDEVLRQYVSV